MTIESKPCPFCGSNHLEFSREMYWPWEFIRCLGCGASGPMVCVTIPDEVTNSSEYPGTEKHEIKRKISELWNQRSEDGDHTC